MSKLHDVLKKDFGVLPLSDPDSPCIVEEWLSTGCLALDAIMGGGVPVGRITEIFGSSSSGKTLIAEQVVAMAQAQDFDTLYLDPESSVSISMMREVGVDVDKLLYHAPDTVEEVFGIMETAIENKDKERGLLIVWDSIAATSARSEMEEEVGKANYGLHAKLISQGLRKLARQIATERVCCLFLNQVRQKLGVMFGDTTVTFGGNAVEFYSSVRIQLKHGKKMKSGEDIVGIQTTAECRKNKVAVPFKEAILPIYFGHGISDEMAAFEWLDEHKLFEGESKGQWKTFKVGDKEIKLSRATWPKVFDEHYEHISKLILEGVK